MQILAHEKPVGQAVSNFNDTLSERRSFLHVRYQLYIRQAKAYRRGIARFG